MMKKNIKTTSQMKSFLIILILIGGSFAASFLITQIGMGTYTYEVKSFTSYDEFFSFLKKNSDNYTFRGYYESTPSMGILKTGATQTMDNTEGGGETVDFSQTNIQVEGVDEPDIVKTDGTYLYIVANSTVYILRAYPAEQAKVLSKIPGDNDTYITTMFIYKDYLVVLGTRYIYPVYPEEKNDIWWSGTERTTVGIYNIFDRNHPVLMTSVEVDGAYVDARMINDFVYLIATEYTYDIIQVSEGNETFRIPAITINNVTENISAESIYYVDLPEPVETMTHVLAVNITTGAVTQKSFLIGYAQNMYVSKNNIYLTSTHYHYPSFLGVRTVGNEQETTILHKISINKDNISYVAQGEVPGHVLNQFSMDEYNGFFRIATTVGYLWSTETPSKNNVYILDENLDRVASVEDIAPGETIYSARFMGDRAYLVTFKKIDPFFTLDLSDPYQPKILGKLKIPGYSDYLHPYDENHIIGIGKNTVEATAEEKEWRDLDFAWYQGVKIALFDVSDFENPKEIAKVVIGDRGTSSSALYDHKAFLFDREKQLLVIPIDLYEIDEDIKQQHHNYTGNIYGEFTFQGVYVYHLSIEGGFEYQGRITHLSEEDMLKSGFYPLYEASIFRSLYIDNLLYTVSGRMVKINDLENLSEISSVTLQ